MKKLFSLLLVFLLVLPMGAAKGGETMANYLYNGVELPELPEWDKEKYPYAVIDYYHKGGTYFLEVSNYRPYCTADTSGNLKMVIGKQQLTARIVDGAWTEFSASNNYSEFDLENGEYYSSLVWTNFDVINDSGSVYHAAGTTNDPNAPNVPAAFAYPSRAAKAWRFNGIELPVPPEIDARVYPYVVLIEDNPYFSAGDYSLVASRKAIYADDYGMSILVPWAYVTYLDGAWLGTQFESYALSSLDQKPLWSNYDYLNADGTIYREASKIVPVLDSNLLITANPGSEAGSVNLAFTCHDLFSTDSVYKVAAWCYPKGTNFQDAPFTYVSPSAFSGTQHIEACVFTGLTPGVEYEVYACILANDVATDSNATVTFTLEGAGELDFTNASLSLQMGKVQHNSYNFKLAYSGMPYNADGTSAVFDIVGVTNAGDEAYMGGRISSGSGEVNGLFMDLETETDYTATFEVYYNGEPTGVKATASFTTEGKHVPGDMNRDSFPLGFASGLCGVPITEADAEYNTWAQGYIAGEALRKAL